MPPPAQHPPCARLPAANPTALCFLFDAAFHSNPDPARPASKPSHLLCARPARIPEECLDTIRNARIGVCQGMWLFVGHFQKSKIPHAPRTGLPSTMLGKRTTQAVLREASDLNRANEIYTPRGTSPPLQGWAQKVTRWPRPFCRAFLSLGAQSETWDRIGTASKNLGNSIRGRAQIPHPSLCISHKLFKVNSLNAKR